MTTDSIRQSPTGIEVLLVGGIASSLHYAAMNVFIPMMWDQYSVSNQTVSELSAIGAPTRPVWIAAVIVYASLYTAFGWGISASAGEDRRLRLAGRLISAQGIIGFFWPPMHLRGAPFTMTDAMHIAFASVTLLLMVSTIGFGAAAFGKRFRLYSAVTIGVFVVFGALTGLASPGIAANTPTPWIGIWERVNIGAFMLWVIVLAGAVLRRSPAASSSA